MSLNDLGRVSLDSHYRGWQNSISCIGLSESRVRLYSYQAKDRKRLLRNESDKKDIKRNCFW